MGFAMKNFKNIGGAIAYNDQYICIGSNKIYIIDRTSLEVQGVLCGERNISCMKMDKQYVYTKTTSGIYCMFDLQTGEEVHRGTCREKKDYAHDEAFFLDREGVILDLIRLKDNRTYLVRYDLVAQNYEKVCLSTSDFISMYWSWFVDKARNRAYILFVEIGCMGKPKTCGFLQSVNLNRFAVEQTLDFTFDHQTAVKGLLNESVVVLDTMETVNLYTGERKMLDEKLAFKKDSRNYSLVVHHLFDDRLLLLFPEKVWLYDLQRDRLLKSYPCSNWALDAQVLDSKLWISFGNDTIVENL